MLAEKLVKIITNGGAWQPVLYTLFQFLQVTFIPVASGPVTITGSLLFPWWECILLTVLGQVTGSMLAFFLGRKFGLAIIYKFCKRETVDKWREKIKGREKTTLIFMFFLPVFPDDLLCLLAGLTDMKYKTFFIVQILSRTIAATYMTFGTVFLRWLGTMNIAFYWWLVIGVVLGVGMTLIVTYQDKISNWFLRVWNKRKKGIINMEKKDGKD